MLADKGGQANYLGFQKRYFGVRLISSLAESEKKRRYEGKKEEEEEEEEETRGKWKRIMIGALLGASLLPAR